LGSNELFSVCKLLELFTEYFIGLFEFFPVFITMLRVDLSSRRLLLSSHICVCEGNLFI